MATTLYPTTLFEITRGQGDGYLASPGTASRWSTRVASTSRGSGATYRQVTTVASNTTGLEFIGEATPAARGEWLSPPLDGEYTISSTITFNVRGYESSMSANACMQVVIDRVDQFGVVQSNVVNSKYTTAELGTSEGAQNWTAAPTSTTFYKGDRIRFRFAAGNYGTMGDGYLVYLYFAGTSAGASGDTYVTFTENLGFLTSAPGGTVIYATNTSEPVVSSDDLTLLSDTFDSAITNWVADNWVPYGDNYAAIAWSSGEGDPSAGSLQITTNSSATDQSCMRKSFGFTLYAGVKYTLRFRIKRISGTGNWQWNFGSEATEANRASNTWNQAITTSWVEKTVSWTPAIDCTDPCIWIACYGTTTQVVVVDGVSITQEYDVVQYRAWTSNGSSFTSASAASVTGWVTPILLKSSGTTGIEWYTLPLQAVTLAGRLTANIWGDTSSVGAMATLRLEVAVCNGDGGNVVVWAAANATREYLSGGEARTIVLAGPDIAITNGQRIRIRLYADNSYRTYEGTVQEMVSGYTLYFDFNAATRDSYLTFPVTLAEYTAVAAPFPYIGGGYYGE